MEIHSAKPKSAIGKRIEKQRSPQVVEGEKKAMFIKSTHSSQTINAVLEDLSKLKRPFIMEEKIKQQIRPFEDVKDIEYHSLRNDASLFVFGSTSKKRPDNIVFGRLFDYHILDMIELGVENFKSTKKFAVEKPAEGSKPIIIFVGEEFEQKEEFKKFSNLLIDFFKPKDDTVQVNLGGLEHLIVCTSTPEKIYFRGYRMNFKKSGTKIPYVELNEMGPSMDLKIRRTKFASFELLKQALQTPNEIKIKKVKNISTNPFEKLGKVHMPRQDIDQMALKKMKGFKRKPDSKENQNANKKPKVN